MEKNKRHKIFVHEDVYKYIRDVAKKNDLTMNQALKSIIKESAAYNGDRLMVLLKDYFRTESPIFLDNIQVMYEEKLLRTALIKGMDQVIEDKKHGR